MSVILGMEPDFVVDTHEISNLFEPFVPDENQCANMNYRPSSFRVNASPVVLPLCKGELLYEFHPYWRGGFIYHQRGH